LLGGISQSDRLGSWDAVDMLDPPGVRTFG
jgi:hypothetical protein